MKVICTILIAVLSLLVLTSYGQNHEFSFDENGRVIFTEVVELEGQREELLLRLENLFDNYESIPETDNSSLAVRDDFLLYQHSLGKITDGRMEYVLRVEIKDNKYRYTVQEFTFTPYLRNRYGRYEAKRGGGQPLAKFLNNKNKKWSKHFVEVHERIRQKTNWLKSGMGTIDLPKEQKIVKLKDDW